MPSDTISALIPHYGFSPTSNRWLSQCIRSLLEQTTPLDRVIVVDDVSPCPPEDTVRAFPEVSLYRNSHNTGPFTMIDRVFADIDSDYILLQDSDDWSSPDRLELLLSGMRNWQTDVIGCQVSAVSAVGDPLESAPDQLPSDPRAALVENPLAHPVILPSTLVSCEFARRIGGLSTGLRFGADSEFARRACLGGKVRNISETAHVRRMHPGSLTQSPATGFGSAARLEVQKMVQDHARSLVASFREDGPLDLSPQWRSTPAHLEHVLGPPVPGL